MSSARIAVVTGASRGIGLAVSEILIKHGVTVIGVARNRQALESAQQSTSELNANAYFIPCAADISSSQGLEDIVASVHHQQHTGKQLVALINNAGVLEPLSKLSDVNIDHLRSHLETNLVSVVALTQKLLPLLRMANGRIVNVSSGASVGAYQGWGAYCMGKAALNMLTQVLAVEEPEIVAVALRPGVVATDMQALIRNEGAAAMLPEQHKKFNHLHMSDSLLPPERPALAIAKLAVSAQKKHSGMFYSWDSPEISDLGL
ncbi:hypothetical protein H4R99_000821 [Coemansia sp. RSA 1722]|nr:hypothetical protein LPJ57_004709 [Coemansia sp. RSA 486]KAJ2234156.1 hypothetical protein IWW45_003630 [Coemansia sp. RSA 485]KAJ2605817.1 hypothetical protein H4R99_000821 [Coemansia sp. RSA 1722]KAJ2638885.1 hypothetical protein GGF40_001288 [Coemansia sp. RSA 1286]